MERGGEVTYHGPGQLVAYPIVRLRDRGVLLRPFVRALESAMSDVAASYGVAAGQRPGYPGVWVEPMGPRPRKLGALGLRLEHGITYHGIALNITTRLSDFELIDPCGMAGLDVTSIARELGWTRCGGRAIDGQRRGGRATLRRGASPTGSALAAERTGAPVVAGETVGRTDLAVLGGLTRMAGGLFELRRDDITGWWVATVVDREFERARFARPARRLATPDEACQNCRSAPTDRRLAPRAQAAGLHRRRRRADGSGARVRRAAGRPGRRSAAWASSATSAPGRPSPRRAAITPRSGMRPRPSSSRC